jgi:hypothetical protein
LACFQRPKKTSQATTFYHAIHHNFTTKKPPAAHPIFQNHPQKHGQIDGFTPWRHIQIFSEIQTKFFEI